MKSGSPVSCPQLWRDGNAVAADGGYVARRVGKFGTGQAFELFGQFDVQAVRAVGYHADVVVAQFGRVGYAAFDVHGAAQFAFNVRAAVTCKVSGLFATVQLAAVYGIGAGVAQCAGCDVFKLYGFAAVFADEADGVGRVGAGFAGVVNVLHRGVEADFGYAVLLSTWRLCPGRWRS